MTTLMSAPLRSSATSSWACVKKSAPATTPRRGRSAGARASPARPPRARRRRVHEPREVLAADGVGEHEEEVLQPLLAAPEASTASRRARRPSRTGADRRGGTSSDRRRPAARTTSAPRPRGARAHTATRSPGERAARSAHRAHRSHEVAPADHERHDRHDGERERPQRLQRGQRERHPARDPEPDRRCRQEMLVRPARQRTCCAQADHAGRAARRQDDAEQHDVDHDDPADTRASRSRRSLPPTARGRGASGGHNTGGRAR